MRLLCQGETSVDVVNFEWRRTPSDSILSVRSYITPPVVPRRVYLYNGLIVS